MLDYNTLENQKQLNGKDLEANVAIAKSFKLGIKQLLTQDAKGLNCVDFNWTDGCEDLELRGIQIHELVEEIKSIWPLVACGLGERTYSRRIVCYPYDVGGGKTIEAYVNSRKDRTIPVVVHLSKVQEVTHNNHFMIFGEQGEIETTRNLIKNLSTSYGYRSNEPIPFRRPL